MGPLGKATAAYVDTPIGWSVDSVMGKETGASNRTLFAGVKVVNGGKQFGALDEGNTLALGTV
jgi:hypothetical protein